MPSLRDIDHERLHDMIESLTITVPTNSAGTACNYLPKLEGRNIYGPGEVVDDPEPTDVDAPTVFGIWNFEHMSKILTFDSSNPPNRWIRVGMYFWIQSKAQVGWFHELATQFVDGLNSFTDGNGKIQITPDDNSEKTFINAPNSPWSKHELLINHIFMRT